MEQAHAIEVNASPIKYKAFKNDNKQYIKPNNQKQQKMYDYEQLQNYFHNTQENIPKEILQTVENQYTDQTQNKIAKEINQGKTEVENESEDINEMIAKQKMGPEEERALNQKLKRQQIEKRLEYLENQTSVINKTKRKTQGNPELFEQFKPPNVLSKEEHEQYIQRIKKSREERNKKHKEMVAKIEQSIKQEEQRLMLLENEKINHQRQKRRAEIQKNLEKKKQQRSKMIQQQKQSQQQYKKILKKQFLHEKMEEKYQNEILLPALEQKKKKLKEIREMSRAFNVKELIRHQKQYIEKRNQSFSVVKQKIKQEQFVYKPPKKNERLIKILEEEKKELKRRQEEKRKSLDQKLERKQNYLAYLKENFVPKIDQKKQREIQQRKNQRSKKKQPQIDGKTLGTSYFQQAKKYTKLHSSRANSPTSEQGVQMLETNLQKNSSKRLTDYLTSSRKQKQYYDQKRKQRLQNIINSHNVLSTDKIMRLKQQSQKLNQAFARKAQLSKIKKQKIEDDDSALELLLDGIKAKMGIMNIYRKQTNQI